MQKCDFQASVMSPVSSSNKEMQTKCKAEVEKLINKLTHKPSNYLLLTYTVFMETLMAS